MQRSATDLAELCYSLLVSLFVSNYMETACTMDYPRDQAVYIHLPYLPSLCLMLWRIHSWLDDVCVCVCEGGIHGFMESVLMHAGQLQ